MTISYDRKEWRKAAHDTLFNAICLKTTARKGDHDPTGLPGGLPELCGRLCKPEISAENRHLLHELHGEYVVIGHGWMDADHEKFVWRGNDWEFRATWTID